MAYTEEDLKNMTQRQLYALDRDKFQLDPKHKAELTKQYNDLDVGPAVDDFELASVLGELSSKAEPQQEAQPVEQESPQLKPESLKPADPDINERKEESIAPEAPKANEPVKRTEIQKTADLKTVNDYFNAYKSDLSDAAKNLSNDDQAIIRESIERINDSQEKFNNAIKENDYVTVGEKFNEIRTLANQDGLTEDKAAGADAAILMLKEDIHQVDLAAQASRTKQAEAASLDTQKPPAQPEVAAKPEANSVDTPKVEANPEPKAAEPEPSFSSKVSGYMGDAITTMGRGLGSLVRDKENIQPAEDAQTKVPQQPEVNTSDKAAKPEVESPENPVADKKPQKEGEFKPSLAKLDGDGVSGVAQGSTAISQGDDSEKGQVNQPSTKDTGFRAVGSGDNPEKGTSAVKPAVKDEPNNSKSVDAPTKGAEGFRAVGEDSPSAPVEKSPLVADAKDKTESKTANQPDLSKYEALSAAVQSNGGALTDNVNHNDDKAFNQIAQAAGVKGIDDQDVIKTSDAKSIQEQGAKLADMLKNGAKPEDLEKAGSELSNAIEAAQGKAVDIGKSGIAPNQVAADSSKEQGAYIG